MSLRNLSVEDPKLYPLHLDDHDPHGLQHFQFGDSYLFLTPTKSKPMGPIVQNFDNQLRSLITRAVWESLWLEISVSVPLLPAPTFFSSHQPELQDRLPLKVFRHHSHDTQDLSGPFQVQITLKTVQGHI